MMHEREKFLDMVRSVLDRQVLDANLFPCGKVDDIEIEGETRLRISAILIGNGAASERLPDFARGISQKIFGQDIVRVPWSDIKVIGQEVRLWSTAEELGLDERKGFVYRLISKLPGACEK